MNIDTVVAGGTGAQPGIVPEGQTAHPGQTLHLASHAVPSVDVSSREHLIEQYRTLGLSHDEALRLFDAACAAVTAALSAIDAHAFTAAPFADRISMLLPRVDVGRLAASVGISTAQAQSAIAMLALESVLSMHFSR